MPERVPLLASTARFATGIAIAAMLAATPPTSAQEAPGSSPGARRNHLAGEASPYLQMHVYNPVDWYPWSEEALARAKREDKPIFLSIGYSTCYWCHVMERRVFSDPAIARLMNASFVNIKVDREERPDIDTVYMRAAQILTGSGGWPNSVFLTPDRLPFFAGTYFPPDDAPGRPGFPTVLASIAAGWKDDRDEVVRRAHEVERRVRASFAPAPGVAKSFDASALLAAAVAELALRYEPLHGGFSEGTKFPSPSELETLLAAQRLAVGDGALEMLSKTLDEMALGGINDHLGGGFHRYATEPTWSVPHFEKMLYDNAQLLSLYARAHAATGEPLYAQVAETIAHYLMAEMAHPYGAFYAAQDAEVGAEEGASYVWTAGQIRDVLGDEPAAALLSVYQLVPVPGRAQGAGALRVALPVETSLERSGAPDVVSLLDRFAASRAALLASRARREQPLRDEKILAGWNGLAIRGLADAGVALDRPAWILAGKRAAHHVLALLREPDGRLRRSHVAGLSHEEGVLADYAFLTDGLLALYAATGEPRWLEDATGLADRMLEHFEGPPGTGFFEAVARRDADALFVRPRVMADGPVPSGNGVALRALLGLSERTLDPRYAAAADRTLAALSPEFEHAPSSVGTALAALARDAGPLGAEAAVARAATGAAPPRATLAKLPTGRDYVTSKVVRSATEPGRARVVVDIADGWHVNANPASLAFLIPTAVELVVPGESGPATGLVSIVYPPGVEYEPRFSLEPLAVYEGGLEIPIELPEPLPKDARIALTFQACDATTCLRPETLELAIP